MIELKSFRGSAAWDRDSGFASHPVP
jgi:hypothetical protein